MACEFEIIVGSGAGSEIPPQQKRQALIDIVNLALDEIERLDETLSRFRPTSEVSFVNAEAARGPVIAGPDLFEILRFAKQVWRDTDGAFDVALGPLVDLWREAERTGNPPHAQAIGEALKKVGMGHVLLDEETHAVRFDIDGVRIDLGAIGKGYAVRKAASILVDYGIESALVSGGGSTIQAIGSGWNVGIRHPSKLNERVTEIELNNMAMSTSGGPAQRDRDVEERFEHIIDPATGMPAQSTAASVSVITDDAMLSDALATAFYLRGREFAEGYCREHVGIKAIFVPFE